MSTLLGLLTGETTPDGGEVPYRPGPRRARRPGTARLVLVDELTEAMLDTPAAVVVATHDRQMLAELGAWPRLELP